MDLLQKLVHSDAEAISTDFLSRKSRNISGTSSTESNLVRYPVEENIEGGSHDQIDVSGDISGFLCRQRNYWVITRELLGNYWGIPGQFLVNY